MGPPASFLERKTHNSYCWLWRRGGMLGLTRTFRDMATGHALYPFAHVFTTKTNLVFGIALRATGTSDELLFNHEANLLQTGVAQQGIHFRLTTTELGKQFQRIAAAALGQDGVAKVTTDFRIHHAFFLEA